MRGKQSDICYDDIVISSFLCKDYINQKSIATHNGWKS